MGQSQDMLEGLFETNRLVDGKPRYREHSMLHRDHSICDTWSHAT